MDRLDNHTLGAIFKHLDLPSRLQASKTCKFWRALLRDSESLLDDVSEIYLKYWKPGQDKSEIATILAVFSNFKNLCQLTLGPDIADEFLLELLLIRDERNRPKLEKVVITQFESMSPCVLLLPSTVTHLHLDDCVSFGFSLDLPEWIHLKALNLTFNSDDEDPVPPNLFALPPTLTAYGFAYHCSILVDQESGAVDYLIDAIHTTHHFLGRMQSGPLLADLTIGGLIFEDQEMSDFLRRIQDGIPNLHRVAFEAVLFVFEDFGALREEFSTRKESRMLPIQWIKFEKCMGDWEKAAYLLLLTSDVKTILISLRMQARLEEVGRVYKLMPTIKARGTNLELTINSVGRSRDLEDIPVPSELSDVLTKLELIAVHHTQLLQILFCGGDSFVLLTEIRLEGCIGLGDAALEIVAKQCKHLKKFRFQPHHCLGLNAFTDRCLHPFMVYWNDQKSDQLSIECLKPSRPFGGFNLPIDQEKGVFQDGKKWMIFRKAYRLDGCDQNGTRLLIWDGQITDGPKSMVVTDYKRKFEYKVQISVVDGVCHLKENRCGI